MIARYRPGRRFRGEAGLTGASSNRCGAVELSKVEQVRLTLQRRSTGEVLPRVFVPNRPQPVRATVLAVMAEASGELRAVEVRHRVEQRLGEAVNWSTVRDALVDLASQADGPVERVAYGRYRHDGRTLREAAST